MLAFDSAVVTGNRLLPQRKVSAAKAAEVYSTRVVDTLVVDPAFKTCRLIYCFRKVVFLLCVSTWSNSNFLQIYYLPVLGTLCSEILKRKILGHIWVHRGILVHGDI